MFVISHGALRLALMLATGLGLSIASTAGHAYTMEEEQACSGDAFRLCSSEIPFIDRITACMIRNKSELSPQCRAFFRPARESGALAGDPPGKSLHRKPATARKFRAHRIKRPRPDAT